MATPKRRPAAPTGPRVGAPAARHRGPRGATARGPRPRPRRRTARGGANNRLQARPRPAMADASTAPRSAHQNPHPAAARLARRHHPRRRLTARLDPRAGAENGSWNHQRQCPRRRCGTRPNPQNPAPKKTALKITAATRPRAVAAVRPARRWQTPGARCRCAGQTLTSPPPPTSWGVGRLGSLARDPLRPCAESDPAMLASARHPGRRTVRATHWLAGRIRARRTRQRGTGLAPRVRQHSRPAARNDQPKRLHQQRSPRRRHRHLARNPRPRNRCDARGRPGRRRTFPAT